MFGQRNDEVFDRPRDMLAVFKEDGTADIIQVVSINEERLLAGPFVGESQYSIPLGDLRSFTGPNGRVFLWPTTVENVTDCQRIAALERSTVLKQITHYQEHEVLEPKKPLNWKVIIGGGLAALLLIIMVAN